MPELREITHKRQQDVRMQYRCGQAREVNRGEIKNFLSIKLRSFYLIVKAIGSH